MIDKAGQKRLMVQYLLGELPADERAEFEDVYLKDTDVFQELVALENEMIDEYILGELSEGQREKFERSFLANPSRRETVETARSLLAYSAAAENAVSSIAIEPRRKRLYGRGMAQLATAVIFLIMLGGISWLILNNRRMASDLEKLQRERSAAIQDKKALQQQLDSQRADLQQHDRTIEQISQLPSGTVPFTLGPGISRGDGEPTTLIIPPRAAYVLLRVFLQDDSHSSYSFSIRTVEGDLVWRQSELEGTVKLGHSREVAAIVPSRLLKTGDYVLRVSAGSEDILHTLAGYSFHVTFRTQ